MNTGVWKVGANYSWCEIPPRVKNIHKYRCNLYMYRGSKPANFSATIKTKKKKKKKKLCRTPPKLHCTANTARTDNTPCSTAQSREASCCRSQPKQLCVGPSRRSHFQTRVDPLHLRVAACCPEHEILHVRHYTRTIQTETRPDAGVHKHEQKEARIAAYSRVYLYCT